MFVNAIQSYFCSQILFLEWNFRLKPSSSSPLLFFLLLPPSFSPQVQHLLFGLMISINPQFHTIDTATGFNWMIFMYASVVSCHLCFDVTCRYLPLMLNWYVIQAMLGSAAHRIYPYHRRSFPHIFSVIGAMPICCQTASLLLSDSTVVSHLMTDGH